MANERLVEFLYILGRDYLKLGDLETIMWENVNGGEPDSYCNSYLEGYARDLATRLTDESAPVVDWKHMLKEGAKSDGLGERWWIGQDGRKVPAPYKPPTVDFTRYQNTSEVT